MRNSSGWGNIGLGNFALELLYSQAHAHVFLSFSDHPRHSPIYGLRAGQ